MKRAYGNNKGKQHDGGYKGGLFGCDDFLHNGFSADAYGNMFTGNMLDMLTDTLGDSMSNQLSKKGAERNITTDMFADFANFCMYDSLRYLTAEAEYPGLFEDPFEYENRYAEYNQSVSDVGSGEKSRTETAPAIHSMQDFIIRYYGERLQRELVEQIVNGDLARTGRASEVIDDTVRLGNMTFWRTNNRICTAYIKLSITVCESNDGHSRFADCSYTAEIIFDMTTDNVETHITYYPYCCGLDQPISPSAWKLDDYLVPILDKEGIEKAAWELHCKYCHEAVDAYGLTRDNYDAYELARRMGLQVKALPLHKMPKTKSLLFFSEQPLLVNIPSLGDENKTEWIKVPSNCIVINSSIVHTDENQLEVFHECFHYDAHYLFYRLQNMASNDLTTVKRVPTASQKHKRAKKSVMLMESQARRGSYGLMMPKPVICLEADRLIRQYKPQSRHAGDLYERIIYAIHKERGLACFRIRARLIQIGYVEAYGAYNYANGKRIPAFAFDRKNMDAGSTYVIDRKELAKEYIRNRKLRQMVQNGDYIYVDGHVCINRPEYIRQSLEGPRLSDWAERHVDKCCLRFRSVYELNEISEYEFGRLACDDDYNKHYFNYIDTTGLTPGAAYRERLVFLSKLPDGFFAALDFIRNEKHITLENLEELSHVSRKKIERERKKVKWALSRDEVVALCIGLKMPPWLSKEMLRRAHIALDDHDPIDSMYSMILELYYSYNIDYAQELLRQEGLEEMSLSSVGA